MNVDPEDKSDPLEASFEPQTTPNPPDPPRKRKRKFDQTEPLDSPVDEAIAEYLATPKSIRQFKSFSELAEYFSVPAQQGFERLTTGRVASHAAPARRRPRRTPPLAANRGWTSKGRNCRKYQSRGILQRTRVVWEVSRHIPQMSTANWDDTLNDIQISRRNVCTDLA
jgi:hypothetical protein